MNIRLNYTYNGTVPEKSGLYFCIYLDPSGEPMFGLARAERNILSGEWEWNPEIGKAFGGAAPFCYMEVQGSPDAILPAMETLGTVTLTANEQPE